MLATLEMVIGSSVSPSARGVFASRRKNQQIGAVEPAVRTSVLRERSKIAGVCDEKKSRGGWVDLGVCAIGVGGRGMGEGIWGG